MIVDRVGELAKSYGIEVKQVSNRPMSVAFVKLELNLYTILQYFNLTVF